MGAFTRPQTASGNPQTDPRGHAEAGVGQIVEDAGTRARGDGRRHRPDYGGDEMKLKYLCGSCLLGGALMLKAGAPLLAVLAGIALVVAWYAFRKRGAKA